jgi:hypothetical protein
LYVSNEILLGRLNGACVKISVLLLNDARITQISGAMTSRPQTARATWAKPLKSLISFFSRCVAVLACREPVYEAAGPSVLVVVT